MKKQIFGFILTFMVAGLFLTQCQKENQPLGQSPEPKGAPVDWSYLSHTPPYTLASLTNTDGDPLIVPLYAGKTNLVGNVTVDQVGGNLIITFNITKPGVTLVSSHLSVTAIFVQIPLSSGNPPPGQFNCNSLTTDGIHYEVPIPSPLAADKKVFIAAHAVVTGPGVGDCVAADCSAVAALIPASTANAIYSSGNYLSNTPGQSYVVTNIANGTPATINGKYEGWCVDLDHGTSALNQVVKFIPTCAADFATQVAGFIDHPENIQAVNWVLNQHFVGKTADCGSIGIYTVSDVQAVIWKLLEHPVQVFPDISANMVRVNCMYGEALTHTGFTPDCGDLIGIVLKGVCDYINQQPTIIGIAMPCKCAEETAWSIGLPFPGNNWAMYFNYLIATN